VATTPATHFSASAVYGQYGSFISNIGNLNGVSASSLLRPKGVAVPGNGGIYVADYDNNRVLYFPYDSSTHRASTTAAAVYGQGASGTGFATNASGASATGMYEPRGVAVDGSGGIYVADLGNNRVLYFPYDSSTGRASTTATTVYGQGPSGTSFTTNAYGAGATSMYEPWGVAVDGSGGLYVAEYWNNRVLYFPYDSSMGRAGTTATTVYGQPDFTSRRHGTSATNMFGPMGVAVDGSGNLYVADSDNNRVLYFPYDSGTGHASTTVTTVYGQGASGISFATNAPGTSATSLYFPQDVAVDGSGDLYVADSFNSRVLYFSYDGSTHRASTIAAAVYGQPDFTSSGYSSSATSMDLPVGVAVDGSGGLYVADANNNRLLYFASQAPATATNTTTPVPPTVVPPVAQSTALPTPLPTTPPRRIPSLVIYNEWPTEVGGRTLPCDIPGNTHGAHEPGCEIVSSIWLPGASVTYTITYPDGSWQTFTDVADYRGHSLHPFNVAYLPQTSGRTGPDHLARIMVTAVSRQGLQAGPVRTQFAVIRP
jgi:sugar lactone lactonase YvrE